MADAWRRGRCCVVAAGLNRVPCLLALLQLLQCHVWLTRRRHHSDAVALLHRRRSVDRWRGELRDRERRRAAGRARSKRKGRESTRRERRRRTGGVRLTCCLRSKRLRTHPLPQVVLTSSKCVSFELVPFPRSSTTYLEEVVPSFRSATVFRL